MDLLYEIARNSRITYYYGAYYSRINRRGETRGGSREWLDYITCMRIRV